MNEVYLSTAYFPPVQYFTKLVKYEKAVIEAQENFLKQSYRNRCYILGSNGRTSLSVPVQKANSGLPIQEMKIDYSEDWQRQHERALLAAYGSSPFYEHYISDFNFVFHEHTETLWKLNNLILTKCCELLEINPQIVTTETFQQNYPNDFRQSIHPKKTFQKEDANFSSKPYVQVFSDKFNFAPNLSILDLLFNVGTEAEIYLLNAIAQR